MFTEGLMRARALPRVDLGDRGTQYALGGIAIGGIALALALAVGTGQFVLAAGVALLALAPALVVAAFRWPYVFPYGLYILLVPFDNLLSIGAGTLTRYLSLASVAALALLIVTRRRGSSPSLALYLWGGFLAYALLSILWTPATANAMMTAQQLVSVILLLAMATLAPVEERELRLVCAFIVLYGVVASAYGMVLLHNNPALAGDEGRLMLNVDGRDLDPNALADSLLAPFAFAFISLLHARKPWKVAVSVGALGIIAGGIVVALSREAFLACLAIVVVTAWFSRRRVLTLLAMIPFVAAVPMLVPAIGARMSDALSTGGAGRTSIWSVDFQAFLQHPFFGWGAGSEIDAYNANYLSVFEFYNAGWSRPPHNTVLFVAVELGIIGVLLFYGAWLAAFRPLAGVRRDNSLYDLRVAITAALIALLIASAFLDMVGQKFFWLALAVAAQFRAVALSQRTPAGEPTTIVYEAEAGSGRARRGIRSLRPRLRNGSST
ncbi:MAG TPA: O-antigen ligase family protein [Candidatus Baltobacteraceae bacterium]|nr:O-antigen ligase family protein [Candidatus Baltobacteraceae bacterium]